MKEPDADQELRHVVVMVQASARMLRRALGAQVIASGWQPGQPVAERLRTLQAAEDDLKRALGKLQVAIEHADRSGRERLPR